jgi:hypothetical protein
LHAIASHDIVSQGSTAFDIADDDIVLYVDAYDVIMLADAEELVGAFLQLEEETRERRKRKKEKTGDQAAAPRDQQVLQKQDQGSRSQEEQRGGAKEASETQDSNPLIYFNAETSCYHGHRRCPGSGVDREDPYPTPESEGWDPTNEVKARVKAGRMERLPSTTRFQY